MPRAIGTNTTRYAIGAAWTVASSLDQSTLILRQAPEIFPLLPQALPRDRLCLVWALRFYG